MELFKINSVLKNGPSTIFWGITCNYCPFTESLRAIRDHFYVFIVFLSYFKELITRKLSNNSEKCSNNYYNNKRSVRKSN